MKKENRRYNSEVYCIWTVIIFLCAFGLIMVFSASAVECGANERYNFDSAYLMKNN